MVVSSSSGFLPKSSTWLLQLTTGAPTLCSVQQQPMWFCNYQPLRVHRKPGPEPPYPAPLQLIGATLSELLQGRVGPSVLFWVLGGVHAPHIPHPSD